MDDATEDGYSTPSLYGRPATAVTAEPPRPSPSRRGVLIGGGLVVVAAAGVGVALGRSAHQTKPGPVVAPVPADLAAAADAERALIATIDAALRPARGAERTELRLIRADHAAHLAAITSAIASGVYPAVPSVVPTTPTAAAPAPSRRALRTAETQAATSAAARALRLLGPNAVLLASIAAAEATHAELLS